MVAVVRCFLLFLCFSAGGGMGLERQTIESLPNAPARTPWVVKGSFPITNGNVARDLEFCLRRCRIVELPFPNRPIDSPCWFSPLGCTLPCALPRSSRDYERRTQVHADVQRARKALGFLSKAVEKIRCRHSQQYRVFGSIDEPK